MLSHTRQLAERGKEERAAWQATFSNWQQANPDAAKLFERLASGELPADLGSSLPELSSGEEIATRAASGKVINAIASKMPELWGGSADLAE